jgi:Fur family ferric uptake transcriptional regulator
MQIDCINIMNFGLTLSSLQDKKCRITKVRQEIVKIFSDYSVPLSANRVEELLSGAGIGANKTTIYRELQFLLSKGYLTEVYLFPKEICYESSDLKHHHHLVCDRCGNVDNVTDCLVKKLGKDVYKKKGFKIKRHTLEFYGICAKCAGK